MDSFLRMFVGRRHSSSACKCRNSAMTTTSNRSIIIVRCMCLYVSREYHHIGCTANKKKKKNSNHKLDRDLHAHVYVCTQSACRTIVISANTVVTPAAVAFDVVVRIFCVLGFTVCVCVSNMWPSAKSSAQLIIFRTRQQSRTEQITTSTGPIHHHPQRRAVRI